MVQTHGSVQLSMGAALLEGLIDADTSFSLCLLTDAEGKARDATITLVREIFSLMEIQGNVIGHGNEIRYIYEFIHTCKFIYGASS